MTESKFSTECEQYTVNVVIDAIRNAYSHIIEKIQELEKLENAEGINGKIAILKLRLDLLLKVENNLLIPLVNEYMLIEKSARHIAPGELSKIVAERQSKLAEALLQGI